MRTQHRILLAALGTALTLIGFWFVILHMFGMAIFTLSSADASLNQTLGWVMNATLLGLGLTFWYIGTESNEN